MDVNDLPASGAFDEDAAFVVGAVGEAAVSAGAGEHECVSDNCRVAIELQAGFQEIVAKVTAGAGPGVVDHKEVEVEPILAMGGDEPLV